MSADILSLPNARFPEPGAEGVGHVVAALRAHLAMAQRGEIQAFDLVYVDRDGTPVAVHVGMMQNPGDHSSEVGFTPDPVPDDGDGA